MSSSFLNTFPCSRLQYCLIQDKYKSYLVAVTPEKKEVFRSCTSRSYSPFVSLRSRREALIVAAVDFYRTLIDDRNVIDFQGLNQRTAMAAKSVLSMTTTV